MTKTCENFLHDVNLKIKYLIFDISIELKKRISYYIPIGGILNPRINFWRSNHGD